MSALLCASPRCAPPGRHADSCDDGECRGCQPARAADGLALCAYCTRRIGADAVEAARLWYEIGWVLNGQGSNGTVVVSNPHPGLNLSDRAVAARRDVHYFLVSWCRLIAEERGIGLPGDGSQHALGAYVARHSTWLAASEAAADAAAELRDLRTAAWSAAYPEGASIVEIGTCPEMAAADPDAPPEPCTGIVRAILRDADSNLPNKVVCDADSTHVWPSERWRTLGRAMGKLWGRYQPADIIALAYARPIGTIYWLASTKGWRSVRQGRRSLYSTDDAARDLEGVAA